MWGRGGRERSKMEEELIQIMNISSFQQLAHQMEISVDTVCSLWQSRFITISSAVTVAGHKDLSVLVGPEPIEINQNAGNSVSLTAIDQVLKGDFVRVLRLHHIKDFIL